jgi:hypothetical protein
LGQSHCLLERVPRVDRADMRMPATNEIPQAAQDVAGVVDVRQHECQIAVGPRQIAAGGAQRCCADRPSARAAVMGWLIRPPTRPRQNCRAVI